MRKFYNFFALLLLSIFGATNAGAQYYQFDTQIISSVEDLVGKEFVLRGGFNYDEGRVLYPGGNADVTKNLSENCLYTLVKLEGELSSDGKQTYALKHVRTNKYVVDKNLDTNPNALAYTSEVLDAQKLVVLPSRMPVAEVAAESPYSDRQVVIPGSVGQRFTDDGFTMTTAAWEGAKYGANDDGVDSAFVQMSMRGGNALEFVYYLDGNYWEAWTIKDAEPLDIVLNAVNIYFPNGFDASQYPAGTNPGEFDATLLASIGQAYEKAAEYLNSGQVSLEEAKACAEELEKAAEDLTKALIMPTAGHYFVTDFRATSNTWYASEQNLRCKQAYEIPETPLVADTPYFMEFIPVKDKEGAPVYGKFLIKNFYHGNYANSAKGGYDTGIYMMDVLEKADTFTLRKAQSPLGFEIVNEKGEMLNSAVSKGGITNWNVSSDVGSQWKLTPIAESVVEGLKGAIDQDKLNVALQAVYEEAEYLKAEQATPKYSGEASLDSNFIDHPGFVIDPVQIVVDPNEPYEGSIANMFDSNVATYMHTAWSFKPNPTHWHYMQVDLGESKQSFQMKYAKRLRTAKNNNPHLFRVWATNDTTGGGEWTDEGWTSFTYEYAAKMGETEYANSIGISGVTLSKPYRYVRLECRKTFDNQLYHGYPIWYLSEIRFYEGEAISGSSLWESTIPVAERSEFDKQFANAAAKLEAGTATQEDIDLLQAALDAVVACIPDPSKVTAALNAAKAISNGTVASEDGEVGTYPAAAKTAFETAIENATEAAAKENLSIDEINKIVGDLSAAKDTYLATVTLPEAGKAYIIYGPVETLRGYNALVGLKNCQLTGNAINYLAAKGDEKEMVDYTTRPQVLWVVEKAASGKLVLKNVGTGLYWGLSEKEEASSPIAASKEPVEILMKGTATPGIINMYAGKIGEADAYINFGASGIVSWTTAVNNDNSAFAFMEAVNLDTDGVCNWPAAAGYQVMTLPFSISGECQAGGTIYDVLGVNDAQQLVLTVHDGAKELEAGTPFVFWGDDDPDFGLIDGCAMFMLSTPVGENGELAVSHEALDVNGVKGVLLESEKVGEGKGVFYNGNLRVTNAETPDAAFVVPAGSGYFHADGLATGVTAGEEDVLLDLGNPLTSIGNVVVLPARVDVYTLGGVLVRKDVKSANAVKGLPAGVYVVGGQKVLVK